MDDRRKSQADLSSLEEEGRNLQALLNAIHEPAFLMDVSGKVIVSNETTANNLGVKLEELIGSNIYSYLPADVAASRKGAVQQVLETKSPYRFEDERSGRILDNSIYPIFDSDGNVVRLAIIGIDITPYKEVKEALQESQERYRELYNHMGDGAAVFEASADGDDFIIKDMNPAGLELCETTLDKIVGRSILEMFPGVRQLGLFEAIQEVWKTGKSMFLPAAIYQDSRLCFWAENYVFRLPSGEIVCIFNNITERKHAEHVLKLNELRLLAQLQLHQMEDRSRNELCDFVLDKGGVITASEMGFLGFVSEDQETMTIHAWSKLAMANCRILDKPIEFQVSEAGLWGEIVRTQRPLIVNDYAAAHPAKKGCPEGHVHISRFMGVPVFEGERVVAVAAMANKQTDYDELDVKHLTLLGETLWHLLESKRKTDALRESEERFRKYFELGVVGMAIAKPNGEWIEVNDQLCAMFGYSREELLQKHWVELTHPDDLEMDKEQFERLIRGEMDRYSIEKRFIHKNGRVMTWIISITCSRTSSGEADRVYGCAVDITHQKTLQRFLERSRADLRELSMRLADLQEIERRSLARELHDQVGQTLTSLGINLNIVRDQLETWAIPEVLDRLNQATEQVEATMERIRNVMADLRPPMLDDYGLYAALCWYGERFERNVGIKTTVEGGDIPMELPSRQETAAFRIVQEALSNVAKHAQASEVVIAVQKTEQGVRISVSDNGIGFDPDEVRTDASSQNWGLTIMNERARAVGAKTHIDSAPGRGTSVIVELAS